MFLNGDITHKKDYILGHNCHLLWISCITFILMASTSELRRTYSTVFPSVKGEGCKEVENTSLSIYDALCRSLDILGSGLDWVGRGCWKVVAQDLVCS